MTMSGDASQAWRGLGDSEIGPLHQRLGLPNQDAFCLSLNEPVLVALSDGVGSRTLSHLGAQAVCRALHRLVKCNALDLENTPEQLIEQFHQLWLEELAGQDIDQCSCTALFAIVSNEQLLTAQIGDGICCLLTSDESLSNPRVEILAEKDSDFFSNQTSALGQDFNVSEWKYAIRDSNDLAACFLVSDGISDDVMPERQEDFFLDLWVRYRHLQHNEIVQDVRRWISDWPVPGHSDDKTIVGIFR